MLLCYLCHKVILRVVQHAFQRGLAWCVQHASQTLLRAHELQSGILGEEKHGLWLQLFAYLGRLIVTTYGHVSRHSVDNVSLSACGCERHEHQKAKK